MTLLTEQDVAPLWDAAMPKAGEYPVGGWLWKHFAPSIQQRMILFANAVLAKCGGAEWTRGYFGDDGPRAWASVRDGRLCVMGGVPSCVTPEDFRKCAKLLEEEA